MNKKVKVLFICCLIAIIAAITLYAATNNGTSRIKLRKSKGKLERLGKEMKPGEAILSTSSVKVTTRGAESNRHVIVRQLTTNPLEDRFADWSPDGQEIVFQAEDVSYDNFGIWKINVDGTGLTDLALPDPTVYPSMCFSKPRWSPLGSKILYQSYGDTVNTGGFYASTFIMNPDGSNRERVSPDSEYCRSHADWSPDGNKMAYKNYRFTERLTILDLTTGLELDVGSLIPEAIYAWVNDFPRFSPDGSKLLFRGDPDEHLCVIDTSGDNYIVIDDVNYNKHYDWSPDGDKIVYTNDRDVSNYQDIWIANPDGSGKTPILEDSNLCLLEVDWQHTSSVSYGRWIVYAMNVEGNYDYKTIWVVTTDGLYSGCLCADTSQSYYTPLPTWSPQGDRIAFSSDCNGNFDIYVIDLDTDDNDYDSLFNWEEFAGYGTDPDDRDTDKGDENDGSEIANGRNPFDPGDDVGAAPPYTDEHNPAPGDTGVSPYTNITLHIKDYGSGVDINSIVMTVEGATVTPTIIGPMHDYTIFYNPPAPFDSGQVIDVTIDATDRAIPPNVMPQDAYSFTITGTGVAEGEIQVPTEFNLFQNTPNPSHFLTTIRFQIQRTAYVTLRIYDASGRLVRTLVDGSKEPGYYSLNWNLRDNAGNTVSKGVYYYTLKAGDYSSTMKMVVD